MGTEQRDELIEYRLNKLEQQYVEVKTDLKGMMEVLNRLDKRFATIPEGGMNCALHQQLMEDMRKEIDAHQVIIDSLQSFKWRAVGIISVIVLIMQLFGATIADKWSTHRDTSQQPIRIEMIVPGSSTNSSYYPRTIE